MATPERRPLKTRDVAVFQRLASWMIARRMRPNAISLSSIVFAAAAGASLAGTSWSPNRWLFLVAAAFVQLRLLANMLDGMVAIGAGEASALGDIWNEVPDRFADSLILVGAGYALGGSVVAGYVAAMFALFTAYLRAFGTTQGVKGLFLGPMAKPHRMATITAACVWVSLVPASWPGGMESQPGAITIALWIIVLGGLVTVVRRLSRIVTVLRNQA